MASRITDNKMGIRGFGRTDDGFKVENIDTTNSSFSEASPIPGIPSTTSRLRVAVAGGQSQDIEARTQVSGSPGRGEGVEVAWRPDSSSDADDWSGWNAPNVVTGWASATFGATPSTQKRSITTLPTSQRPVYMWLDATNDLWKCATFSWSTMDFGSAVSISGETVDDTVTGVYGAICAASETELYAVAVEGDASGELVARVYVSTDQGANWTLSAEGVLPATNDYNRARLLWVPEEAAFSLWLEYTDTGSQKVEQYVSTDYGATWSSVSELAVDTNGAWAVLVFPGPTIQIAYYDGTADVLTRTLSSAQDAVADAVASASIATLTTTDMDGSVDADGVGWLQIRVAEVVHTLGTRDNGVTWTACTVGLHDSSDSSTYVSELACAHAGGRQFIACRWVSDVTTQDPSAVCILAGGWSNITTGFQSPTLTDRLFNTVGSGQAASNQDSLTVLPIEQPGNLTLVTESQTGTPTLTFVDGGTNIVTTVADGVEWNWQPASMGTSPFWMGLVTMDSGNGSTAYFDIRLRTSSRELGVRVYTNKIEVYDNATLDATDSTVDTTSGVEIWAEKGGPTSTASFVAWRYPGTVRWTVVFNEALGQATAATPSPVVYWGVPNSGVATNATLGWHWLRDGINLAAGRAQSKIGAACRGKNLNARPYPSEAIGSATDFGHLVAYGGPGKIGDTATIPAGHDYDVAHIFALEFPSPTVTWRSQDETEQSIIINPRSSVQTSLGSDTLVVYFGNVNFKTAYLEGANGGAYTTLGTWDASTGFASLTGVLTGDLLTPNTSTTTAAGRYIQDHELVGGTANLNGVYRKIDRCDGGVWSTSTTKHPELRLAGALGASGACELWAHSGILVIHDVGSWQTYKIRIPAQTTADGYFEAGVIYITGLKAVGRPWEDRTTDDLRPQAVTVEGESQPGRREQIRRPARTVTISQPQGVLLHHLRNAMTTAPDYIASAADHEPLAARDDLAFALRGLLHQTKSGEEPVVWCAKLSDASGGDSYCITDPTLYLYGRIVSSVQTESARGEEGENEHLRVQSVTIEEITGDPL